MKKITLMLLALCLQAKPIVYQDYFGTHTLSEPPKKVIYLDADVEIPAMLEVWDRVVGISNYYLRDDIVKRTAPLGRMEFFYGGHSAAIDVERLKKMGVDLVVTFPENIKSIEFAKRFGIKFLALRTWSMKQLFENIQTQARIFGKEELAKPRIKAMHDLLDFLQARLKQNTQPKLRVMEVFYRVNQLCGVDSMDSDILRYGGVENIGEKYIKAGRVDVNMENIIKEDPQMIFIWWFSPLSVEDVLHHPLLQSLSAVKNKKVYKLPAFDITSPRTPLISLFIAMKAYPDLFSDVNWQEWLKQYEAKVFGLKGD